MRSRRRWPSSPQLACLGNPDPSGSTAAHPDFGRSTPNSSALRRPPRPAGYQGWWAHARRTQPDSSAGVQTGDPGGLSRRLARCVFSLKTTDGVGFEPTRRFHVCRFSRPVHSTALPPIQTAVVSQRPRTSVVRACRRPCRRRSLASLPPPSAGGLDPPPGIPPAPVPQGSPLTNRPFWPKTVALTPGSRVVFPV